ncbi:MAG: hypothetical protein FWF30_04080, partial [Coriobacteriia bacterium]|nr:hypothetical protein [Coriobacteriia bacterium]
DDGLVAEISTRLRHLFDLDCQPGRVSETLLSMNALDPQFFKPGVRLPGCFDAFEMTVRAVLGQQVTVKAARTLAKRLAAAFGSALASPPATLGHTSTTGAGTSAQPAPTTADAAPETAPVEAPSEPPLLLAFPPPERIVALGDAAAVADQLGPLGVTSQRSRAILSLAQSFVDGSIDYRPGADAKLETEKLVALPGIGPWTAQYIAMRALACPDIFLHTDFGVKKALAGYSPAEALKLAEPWRPWRSYATISLWNWLGRPPAASARQQQKAGRTAPPSRLQVP